MRRTLPYLLTVLLALDVSIANAQTSKQPSAATATTRSAKKRVAPKAAPARPAPARAKKTRAPGPPRAPDPAVRAAVAGAGAQAEPVETGLEAEELVALREAERELFGPAAAGPVAASSGFFPELMGAASGPTVYSAGLPPPPQSLDPDPDSVPTRLDWVTALTLPDIPIRWNARLLNYLEFYRNDPRGRTIVTMWYRKTGQYEAMMRRVLRANGVPEDLLWVAVVESGLRPTVYSGAGAAGLWQFMPGTANLYGLVVDRWVDERMDPVRSTNAAAAYLHDLHRRFGSWDLALASYNMGFGGLLATIRKYNTNDFWDLCRYEAGIPWETTLYVPKIMALAIVGRNPSAFGLDGVQREAALEFDEVAVAPGVSLSAVASAAQVDVADVAVLNPQLLASRVPPRPPGRAAAGLWTVRVPPGSGAKVADNLVRARAREPQLERYVVRAGECVNDIARARATTTANIQQINALRTDEAPRPGTVLLVPPASAMNGAAVTAKPVVAVPVDVQAPQGHRRLFYRVVTGDTLAGVAMAFGVSVDDVRRWNALDPNARLHEGMTLLALVPVDRDVAHIAALSGDEVRVMVRGSEDFFTYYESLRDRVRTALVVQSGDTWTTISRRTGMSVGMLERINRRSRREELRAGERMVVYLPSGAVAPGKKPPVEQDAAPIPGLEAPRPDDLPQMPREEASPAHVEASAAGT